MPTEKNGWLFPEGTDPPEVGWYRIKYGDTAVWDMSWNAHVHLAHEAGVERIGAEVVDSGVDDQGIRYAAVRATVVLDGVRSSALQGADETSQQVRDPEYVYAVAESRALKRAIKKALNIRPADDDVAESADEEARNSGGNRGSGPNIDMDNAPDDVDSPPSEW